MQNMTQEYDEDDEDSLTIIQGASVYVYSFPQVNKLLFNLNAFLIPYGQSYSKRLEFS